MGRVISARRFAGTDNRSTGSTNARGGTLEKQLLVNCMEVHRLTMGLIACSIANEREPGQANPETMALLLGSAQACQSLATLLRIKSEYISKMTEACRQVCLACSEVCSEMQGSTAAQACAQACLACAEACTMLLNEKMTEVMV